MDRALIVSEADVRRCTDSHLVAQLQQLTRVDRKLIARFIVYLGEVDARGLYREHAHSSMYSYLVHVLRMSEPEAYLRLNAARLARRYSMVVELLATGAVHLTALGLISRFLTPANHVELLGRLRGKTKREVLLLVAELDPKPDVPAKMRRAAERRPLSAATMDAPSAAVSSTADTLREPQAASASSVERVTADSIRKGVAPSAFVLEMPREKRGAMTPLGAGRYRLQLTAGQELHDKIEQLKHLLRHQVPNGDLAVIVERAVELLLSKKLKERFAQTVSSTPRAKKDVASITARDSNRFEKAPGKSCVSTSSSRRAPSLERNSRYIPRDVLREVYARDAGQCAFVAGNGRRCAERGALEVHHVVPFALGGRATVENLRLVCRCHNRYYADLDFGREFMRRKSSQSDMECCR